MDNQLYYDIERYSYLLEQCNIEENADEQRKLIRWKNDALYKIINTYFSDEFQKYKATLIIHYKASGQITNALDFINKSEQMMQEAIDYIQKTYIDPLIEASKKQVKKLKWKPKEPYQKAFWMLLNDELEQYRKSFSNKHPKSIEIKQDNFIQ